MLLKSADDKVQQLALMEELQQSPMTPRTQFSNRAPLVKELICPQCREKIRYPEGKFYWNNAKRFGGLQYCREDQSMFA